ncbi:MAG: TetR/AcrR family transcriptional regulator [Chloroflexota bacterium]|nr:TetR/AcrR family transcriptional regulator [Chloroflexota bacterium]
MTARTNSLERDGATVAAPAAGRRRYPRGQGHRLREDLIQAAGALLAESGDARDLSLRAVAKKVGVAAPSIYRHFPDVEHLKVAVVERCFAALAQARADAAAGIDDPAAALLARARAYCRFALAHPGDYQLMFGPDPDLPAALIYDAGQSPGRAAFHNLVQNIRDCQLAGAVRTDADPFELAIAMWAFEHGLVTLRLSRPHFPWPPLDDTLDLALRHLLDLATGPPRR